MVAVLEVSGTSASALFRADAYAQTCNARVTAVHHREDGLVAVGLDQTVFYPTGGGQPGDSGTLVVGDKTYTVQETRKGDALGEIWHLLPVGSAAPNLGDSVEASIDWARRFAHMRFHTALHVLCSQLDGLATGNSIAADKARLDYDSHGSVPDKAELEARVNAQIAAAHAVSTVWITDEEMLARPELIKSMSVKPPMGAGQVRLLKIGELDLQPCGGTHVANTSEIGRIVVTKIENKGKQNRRVHVAFA